MDYDSRPLREQWIIRVPAGDVLKACNAKLVWHTERHEYWSKEREKLKSEAADNLQLDPSEIEKYLSNVSSGYNQPGPRLDPEYVRKLGEADKKVKEHASVVQNLVQWRDTLEFLAGTDKTREVQLELNHEDRVFFHLRCQSNDDVAKITAGLR